MSAGKKILCLFPKYYPYTKYEVHVDNEVRVLSNHFDKIIVFPQIKDLEIRDLPKNVEVDNSFVNGDKVEKLGIGEFVGSIFMVVAELFKGKFLTKLKFFGRDLAVFVQKRREANKLIKIIQHRNLENASYYSVWLNDWALVLSLVRKKSMINKFFTRAHGYDMYDERRKSGYVPFKKFIVNYADSITCIAPQGKEYLTKQFPSFSSKIQYLPLGVFDKGNNPFDSTDFTIASVSNINAVKRVHLIIESLRLVKRPITWYHFGDGELMSKITESAKSLPSNVTVHLKGRIGSPELMHFYATHPVTAYLLVSESEGLPVAIQEAMSFGIPVIATNVGGVPQIVDNENGLLLSRDFNPSELAAILENLPESKLNTLTNRENVKQKWRSSFEAELNYGKFATHILSFPS